MEMRTTDEGNDRISLGASLTINECIEALKKISPLRCGQFRLAFNAKSV